MSFNEFDTAGSWPGPLPYTADSPVPLKSKKSPVSYIAADRRLF